MSFKIDIPKGAEYIIRQLTKCGHETYIVGGCVRDSLLNKTPNDWDICTSATPDEVCEILRRLSIRTIDTGLKHGTVTAYMDKMGSYEITTFRVDGNYSDNRHPDRVKFVTDVAGDLARRDFTINAMAYNHEEGLVDPVGGWGDLGDGIIRCVGNPDNRFAEDALRILRALRFASTYGFKIEKKTAKAIHSNLWRLHHVSAERIREELCKMLCGEGMLDIFFDYSDVLSMIIPELEPCIGFNQNNPYHWYTVYGHIAHAVCNYKGSDISIKVALLLHDIGKPACYSYDGNSGHFYGHAMHSEHLAEKILNRLRFDNKTKNEVLELIRYHDVEIRPCRKTVRRLLNKIGYERFTQLKFVRIADIYGQRPRPINHAEDDRIDRCLGAWLLAKQIIEDQECFKIKDLAVNGHDICSLGVDGVIVGKTLNYLLGLVLDETVENQHDILMEEAKVYLTHMSDN